MRNKLFLTDEAIVTGLHSVDRISVPTRRLMTDAGQMIVPCAFARTGTQTYTAEQLQLKDVAPGDLIEVHRDESQVFDAVSLASFRSSPVTLGHPVNDKGEQVLVTADNSKDYQVGMLEGMPVRDEDLLTGCLVITDKKAIEAIDGGDRELSAGYTCDVEITKDSKGNPRYVQTNIRANHIAIVEKGRAGSSCSIADSVLETAVLGRSKHKAKVVAEVIKVTTPLSLADVGTPITDAQVKNLIRYDELMVQLGTVDTGVFDVRAHINDEADIRADVLLRARFLSDITDSKGKSNLDIMRLVVADRLPELDLKDKSDSYITTRFEILVEDADKSTPMEKVLRDAYGKLKVVDVEYKDPVEEARQKSIARFTK